MAVKSEVTGKVLVCVVARTRAGKLCGVFHSSEPRYDAAGVEHREETHATCAFKALPEGRGDLPQKMLATVPPGMVLEFIKAPDGGALGHVLSIFARPNENQQELPAVKAAA